MMRGSCNNVTGTMRSFFHLVRHATWGASLVSAGLSSQRLSIHIYKRPAIVDCLLGQHTQHGDQLPYNKHCYMARRRPSHPCSLALRPHLTPHPSPITPHSWPSLHPNPSSLPPAPASSLSIAFHINHFSKLLFIPLNKLPFLFANINVVSVS